MYVYVSMCVLISVRVAAAALILFALVLYRCTLGRMGTSTKTVAVVMQNPHRGRRRRGRNTARTQPIVPEAALDPRRGSVVKPMSPFTDGVQATRKLSDWW